MIIESYKINLLDLIILAPLAWGAWRGWIQGFITQGFSLAVLLLGIIAVIRLSGFASTVIFPRIGVGSEVLSILFFTLLFAGIVFLAEFLAKIVALMVVNVPLDMITRGAGAGLGFIKYVFIVGVSIVVFELFIGKLVLNIHEIRDNSIIYKQIYNLMHFVFNFNIRPIY